MINVPKWVFLTTDFALWRKWSKRTGYDPTATKAELLYVRVNIFPQTSKMKTSTSCFSLIKSSLGCFWSYLHPPGRKQKTQASSGLALCNYAERKAGHTFLTVPRKVWAVIDGSIRSCFMLNQSIGLMVYS